MKGLKPFSKTFFSEWFLAPERDEDFVANEGNSEKDQVPVGDLIAVDEKGKGKEEEGSEWTTGSGVEDGFHGGLGLMFKYPGDPRK